MNNKQFFCDKIHGTVTPYICKNRIEGKNPMCKECTNENHAELSLEEFIQTRDNEKELKKLVGKSIIKEKREIKNMEKKFKGSHKGCNKEGCDKYAVKDNLCNKHFKELHGVLPYPPKPKTNLSLSSQSKASNSPSLKVTTKGKQPKAKAKTTTTAKDNSQNSQNLTDDEKELANIIKRISKDILKSQIELIIERIIKDIEEIKAILS